MGQQRIISEGPHHSGPARTAACCELAIFVIRFSRIDRPSHQLLRRERQQRAQRGDHDSETCAVRRSSGTPFSNRNNFAQLSCPLNSQGRRCLTRRNAPRARRGLRERILLSSPESSARNKIAFEAAVATSARVRRLSSLHCRRMWGHLHYRGALGNVSSCEILKGGSED